MKYLKMLGLLAVAAASLMAFAGTASATITNGGGAYDGPLVSSSSNSELDGSVDVKCKSSVVEGSVEKGNTSGTISNLSFTECGGDTVTPIPITEVISSEPTVHKTYYGSLAVASNGTVTSSGAEVTVQLHRSIFGFPITTHCIYATNNTAVGTLTEGVNPAVIHLSGTNIPQKPTDSACGESAQWTGTYTVSTPTGAITVD